MIGSAHYHVDGTVYAAQLLMGCECDNSVISVSHHARLRIQLDGLQQTVPRLMDATAIVVR